MNPAEKMAELLASTPTPAEGCLSDHRRSASPYGLGCATTVATPVHPGCQTHPHVLR